MLKKRLYNFFSKNKPNNFLAKNKHFFFALLALFLLLFVFPLKAPKTSVDGKLAQDLFFAAAATRSKIVCLNHRLSTEEPLDRLLGNKSAEIWREQPQRKSLKAATGDTKDIHVACFHCVVNNLSSEFFS